MGSFRPQADTLQFSAQDSASAGPGHGAGSPIGAVVLAAGSGRRFGARKQFLELTPDTRLVDRAVATCSAVADLVVVVLPEGRDWDGPSVYAAVAGAEDRLGSVRRGLDALPDDIAIVLVHDAAHPLASPTLARRLIDRLGRDVDHRLAAAVPWLETPDVVAALDVTAHPPELGAALGRAGLGTVQVPMVFRLAELRSAHAHLESGGDVPATVVEDASLLRWLGHRIGVEAGEVTNVHVVDHASLELVRSTARSVLPPDVP